MLADVFRTGLAALLALGFTVTSLGCASEPKPRPAKLDPSNPAAPESAPLAAPTLGNPSAGGTGGDASEHLHAAPKQPAAAEDAHAHSGDVAPTGGEHDHGSNAAPAPEHGNDHADGAAPAKSVTYTCPMHPEVTSSQPGTCPKCGMKLVPKQPDKGKQ